MAGPELCRTGSLGEREQLVEAEVAVAAPAWVRCLPTGIRGDEGVDDGAAERVAQVERHMREPERVAGLPCRDHGLRRAAGTLRVGAGGIEPEPQRDPDRARTGAQQRHGAVDAAAHRDCDPPRIGCRGEDLGERVRECIGGERLARHGGGLEQRQPGERPREPGRVRVDDPVAVDRKPHERELLASCGVSDDLDHASTGRSGRPGD